MGGKFHVLIFRICIGIDLSETPVFNPPSFDLRELNLCMLGNADIVRFIKSRRIAWLGHVTRMDGGRIPRRILEWKSVCRRIRGRPRKRWIEDVEEDIQTMGIRG